MASFLLKNARISDVNSSWHGKTADILIADGVIANIQEGIIDNQSEIIELNGALLSPSWLDAFATVPDPGANWKQSINNFKENAWEGGFGEVVCLCGEDPLPQKPAMISSLLKSNKQGSAKILPLALATEDKQGKEMTEVYELKNAGAIAVTDGIVSSPSMGLKTKLLEYCASLEMPYLIHPFAQNLVKGGQMHEGDVSVNLGLKGIPFAAETTKLLEDLELAKWLNTPVVILGLSTEAGVEIIRKAKAYGVKVKALVPILNLIFNDNCLEGFDEGFKVLPPLRTEADRKALIDGVLDGTIDGICSNHTPQDVESKKREFPYSDFGASVISEFPKFIASLNQNDNLDLDMILSKLYDGNRSVFNLSPIKIEVGQKANVTAFSMTDSQSTKSKKPYNLITLESINAGIVFQYSGEV